MAQRRLILVTGAPRTATTPVGNLLAQCQSTVSLYEPVGPTGISWIREPFPMVGAELGIEPDELDKLIGQLRAIQLGKFKPQIRPDAAVSWSSRIFGSRTLHSARIAKLRPWARTVIWKDPHAIMLVPDLVDRGVDVVVTARTPWAHAASYKRLGWRSKAAEIYPRWSEKFGACDVCEQHLDQCNDTVVSAALLWRMSYLPLVRTEALADVHLVTSEDLERDERATYLELLAKLGLTATPAVQRTLAGQRREAAVGDMTGKTHDWTRSVASLNRYWQEVVTDADLAAIQAITGDLIPLVLPGTVAPGTRDL
ncbi:MAG TPA: hypothetical protein VGB39_06645 [Sphingomicrobium sp.]|jgi:hypothetical protein